MSKQLKFTNYIDFIQKSKNLPRVFLFSSNEYSYEFDLLVMYYQESLQKEKIEVEKIVYTAESGDFENFYIELTNFNMFSMNRWFVIRNGVEFFKPFLSKSSESLHKLKDVLKLNSDNIYLLIEWNHWEIPKKFFDLFDVEISIINSRSLYSNTAKETLIGILNHEKIKFDLEAMELFIFKMQPSFGAYFRFIKKLKLYKSKLSYSVSDISELIAESSEMNPNDLVDYFMKLDKSLFFREFMKISQNPYQFLSFSSILLERLNMIRIYKILIQKYQGTISEDEIVELLGIQHFSDLRKKFYFGRLKKEIHYFSFKVLGMLVQFLFELEEIIKNFPDKNILNNFIISRFSHYFHEIEKTNKK